MLYHFILVNFETVVSQLVQANHTVVNNAKWKLCNAHEQNIIHFSVIDVNEIYAILHNHQLPSISTFKDFFFSVSEPVNVKHSNKTVVCIKGEWFLLFEFSTRRDTFGIASLFGCIPAIMHLLMLFIIWIIYVAWPLLFTCDLEWYFGWYMCVFFFIFFFRRDNSDKSIDSTIIEHKTIVSDNV